MSVGRMPAGWYRVERNPAAPREPWLVRTDPASDMDGWTLPPSHAVVVLGIDARVWLETAKGAHVVPPGQYRMRPLGRGAAMWWMLAAMPDWRLLVRLLPALFATWSVLGGRAAGHLLVAHYRHAAVRTAVRPTRPLAIVQPMPWMPLARIAVDLRPVQQLAPVEHEDGGWAWECTGEDPSFLVALHAGGMPVVGWYRFRCRIESLEGHLVAPCLYPDYGDGYAPEDAIVLPEPDRAGHVDVLVLLKHPARSLRFDPSVRPARFRLSHIDLRRTTRAGALLRMIAAAGASEPQRRWRVAGGAARQFLHAASRSGLAAAAQTLFERTYGQRRDLQGYDEWVRRYDTLTDADAPLFARRVARLKASPLVSLLLPVYETPEPWLRRCLDSVLAQAYPHWELCVAEDASPSERVRQTLREYAARDPRIRVSFRPSNGHIAEASNTALGMARGEYVGLLDHDDELPPNAVLEMVEALDARPEVAFAYSDEDKIDEQGRRFQPNFKPDWNPDLLLSQNYICHFTVMRAELARRAGGFRKGFEGSQDHDLFLRCTALLEARQIHHVPKILYHWRAVAGSTALARAAKDYASTAGARAVAERARAIDAGSRVEELPHGHYRLHWSLPRPAPKVSIVIPTRDRPGLLRACVESVLGRTRYPRFDLIVVDNGSTDPEAVAYLEALRGREGVHVLEDAAPFNYSAINNRAVAQCDGELVCLLNNDIEVISEDWLEEMASQAMRPGIGAVGAMLYYPDGTIQHAGVILGLGGVANHAYAGQPADHPGHCARALVAQNLSAVTAACLVVRRQVFEQVGGLDERLQVAFNDIDFCLRVAAAGYRNLWTPFARMYHHESASRGSDADPARRERFLGEVRLMEERWGPLLRADPAYNRNLSLEGAAFALAFPPRPPALPGRAASSP